MTVLKNNCNQGMLTSFLGAPSFPEGLPRGVKAASEGVVGVPGSDPDSPLLKRALTSDLARRSRSAAPENKPAKHRIDASQLFANRLRSSCMLDSHVSISDDKQTYNDALHIEIYLQQDAMLQACDVLIHAQCKESPCIVVH